MSEIIQAVFDSSGAFAKTKTQWRLNKGQKLHIIGVDLPEYFEAHFSNSTTEPAKSVLGHDGFVKIPPEYFKPGSDILCWVYVQEGDATITKYQITIPVRQRSDITEEEPTPEQQSALDSAIEALNSAAEDIPNQVNAALETAKESGDFDGYSPTVAVSKISGGHSVNITDVNGEHKFVVMDGNGGSSYDPYVVEFDLDTSTNRLSLLTDPVQIADWITEYLETGTPIIAKVNNDAFPYYSGFKGTNLIFANVLYFYDVMPDLEDPAFTGKIRWIRLSVGQSVEIRKGTTSLATMNDLYIDFSMDTGAVGEVACDPDILETIWNAEDGTKITASFYYDAQDNFYEAGVVTNIIKSGSGDSRELHMWITAALEGSDTHELSNHYLSIRVSDGVILENTKFNN